MLRTLSTIFRIQESCRRDAPHTTIPRHVLANKPSEFRYAVDLAHWRKPNKGTLIAARNVKIALDEISDNGNAQ